jgi:hypothetical protein
LADYDELARRLILTHHTAMIDRNTLERWLDKGAHALRSLFSLAQHYRYSGATREDFRVMNAVARAAIEKFGELPQEVMDGTRRSPFAPPLARHPASGRGEEHREEGKAKTGEPAGEESAASGEAPDGMTGGAKDGAAEDAQDGAPEGAPE